MSQSNNTVENLVIALNTVNDKQNHLSPNVILVSEPKPRTLFYGSSMTITLILLLSLLVLSCQQEPTVIAMLDKPDLMQFVIVGVA